MTTQIEQAMREDIEQLAWMSADTKRHALAKLDTIVNKIGYPDRWRDYSAVEVRRDDHFGNVVRATVFEVAPPAGQDRQAPRSCRVGHDATDGQCLLQPADE